MYQIPVRYIACDFRSFFCTQIPMICFAQVIGIKSTLRVHLKYVQNGYNVCTNIRISYFQTSCAQCKTYPNIQYNMSDINSNGFYP